MRKTKGFWLLLTGLLSIIIFFFGIMYFKTNRQPMVNVVPATEERQIVASAVIDSMSDIIRITALQSANMGRISVAVGAKVKKGTVLFELDNVVAKTNVAIHQTLIEQAQNNLFIHQRVLKNLSFQLKRIKTLDKEVVSHIELKEKMHEVAMASMQVKQMEDNLRLAQLNLQNAKTALRQYTALAPIDGMVLQVNAHENEFVNFGTPVILLADAKKVLVRVSIDERDIQDYNSKFTAFLTSPNSADLKIPLQFMCLHRYIVVQERLNARVQEAVYFFDRDKYPKLTAGQQMDAHIVLHKSKDR